MQNRKQQIIWFTPPFNLKTKTKIGKSFLNLVDRHFPPHNKLRRHFNWTNVKISYSCMPNMNSYIYMYRTEMILYTKKVLCHCAESPFPIFFLF